MKTISFVGNSEPPQKLLELFKKFTPNQFGIWGELKGEPHYDTDYHAVIDYIPDNLKNIIKEEKTVYLGAHPETMRAYRDMSGYKGLKMYDLKHEFGFGEYWIKYDYDYLKNLKPIQKKYPLGAIVSNADTQSYHKARIKWLERFTNKDNLSFDLYGRINPKTENMKQYYRGACGSYDPRGAASSDGNDHMSGKEPIYETHKYMIEFDATGQHYMSERVFDCLLLWSMPIYWGGQGVQKYLPSGCFHSLNIDADGEDVLNIINGTSYEDNLEAIAKARNIILDELLIWPRVHKAIWGRTK